MPIKNTAKKTEETKIKKEVPVKKETPVKIVKKEEASVISSPEKYLQAIGRRKTAVAQVRLYVKGEGKIMVNNKPAEKYFDASKIVVALSSLKMAGMEKIVDASILLRGGGVNAQAEAVRHGLARALLIMDPELRGALCAKGWLTRDSRKVERKKPGLKKARRAPQWSKR
jgi:small subunit ribosomal protein S9